MDFQEQQKELCHLSSFINDQERWIDSVLGGLGWTKDGLRSQVEKCPYNPNHYIPVSSLEAHKVKCWYSTRGVEVDRDTAQMLTSGSTFYSDSTSVPYVHIDHATEEAVVSLAEQLQEESEKSARSSVAPASGWSESVEDVRGTPKELLTLPPQKIISYIKSWKKIPNDFASLQPSSIDVTQVKGWLFQNLPDKHRHSTSLGGEMMTVDTIMKCLTSDFSPASTAPSPNALINKLKPILGAKSWSFVLDLWKYLHISKLQREHGIQDSAVEDIVPLTAAVLLNRPIEETKEEAPLISERVKELLPMAGASGVNGSDTNQETFLPLPMDHVFYKFTANERRWLYDYTVEVSSGEASSSAKVKELDPDLLRDDEAALKAKLKAQKMSAVSDGEEEGGNILEQLKRKRDYRRRRQAYRARNVHITKRTPKEIFRDIINNRMEEIAASAGASEAESKGHTLADDVSGDEHRLASDDRVYGGAERGDREGHSGSPYRERDGVRREVTTGDEDHSEKSKKRRRHRRSTSRSPSAERSRSRERRRKKSKQHKKHRSRSRERSSKSRKH